MLDKLVEKAMDRGIGISIDVWRDKTCNLTVNDDHITVTITAPREAAEEMAEVVLEVMGNEPGSNLSGEEED